MKNKKMKNKKMIVISGMPGSGKTTRLIQYIVQTGGVLAVLSQRRKNEVLDNHILGKNQVFLISEIKDKRKSGLITPSTPVYVEEISEILKDILGTDCAGFVIGHTLPLSGVNNQILSTDNEECEVLE